MRLASLLLLNCVLIVSGVRYSWCVEIYGKTAHSSCICLDGEYVWSGGSGDGVTRYNRKTGEFTVLTVNGGLANNSVLCMAVDHNRTVWFGTRGGVSAYDGKVWKKYTESDGLIGLPMDIECDTDGSVWFATLSGVSRFDGKNWTSYLPGKNSLADGAKCMGIDAQGMKWFGTFGNGISRFDGDSWKTYTMADGLGSNKIIALEVAPDGTVWASMDGGGLAHFDGYTWKTSYYWNYMSGVIRNIAFSPDGTMYFNSYSNSIGSYDGINMQSYTIPNLIGDFNNVFCVDTDTNGEVWVGTNIGVYRFDGTSWKKFNSSIGEDYNQITGIAVDAGGNKWIGTDTVLKYFDGKSWRNYITADGLASGMVNCITVAPDGMVWIGTDQGLSRYDGNSFRTYTTADGLPEGRVTAVTVDSQRMVWVEIKTAGLFRFDGTVWAKYSYGDVTSDLYDIQADETGNLWACSPLIGALRFDGQTWKKFSKPEGLVTKYIEEIAKGIDGETWFGGDGGVSRFDGKSWYNYLAGVYIQDLAIDKRGVAWISIGPDIYRFDGTTWTTYPKVLNEPIQHIAIDLDGSLWLTTDTFVGHVQIPDPLPNNVSDSAPAVVWLHQNFPNPFNPSTSINFSLPKTGDANLTIYNINGQKVRTLVSGWMTPGAHHVVWDGLDDSGRAVSSGVYLSRLTAGGISVTGKMLLVK